MVDFDYFGEGEYTKRDTHVKRVANKLKAANVSVFESLRKYMNILDLSRKRAEGIIGERTASEVVNSDVAGNCVDNTVAYCALARELGMPALFVHTVKEGGFRKWLESGDENGLIVHPFVEIVQDGEKKLYDPLHNYFVNEFSGLLHDGIYHYKEIGRGPDHSMIHLKTKEGYSPKPLRVVKKDELVAALRAMDPELLKDTSKK